MAWGNLQNQSSMWVDYKTLNEGYFESGIELNQIFDWDLPLLPLWSQSLSQFENNIAVKLSYVLNLGSSDWKQTLTNNRSNKVVKRKFSKSSWFFEYNDTH
jgi:hypothetical protein